MLAIYNQIANIEFLCFQYSMLAIYNQIAKIEFLCFQYSILAIFYVSNILC